MERDSWERPSTQTQVVGGLVPGVTVRSRSRWARGARLFIERLLSRRWRRQVVVQGYRFWLPG